MAYAMSVSMRITIIGPVGCRASADAHGDGDGQLPPVGHAVDRPARRPMPPCDLIGADQLGKFGPDGITHDPPASAPQPAQESRSTTVVPGLMVPGRAHTKTPYCVFFSVLLPSNEGRSANTQMRSAGCSAQNSARSRLS